MKNVGQRPGAKGGNSRKRLRIVFSANPPPSQILKAIKGVRRTEPSTSRLTAQQLNKVTSYHIWLAVQDLRKKPSNHNFGPSTKYDVMLEDNERLPAKAVFGKALEKALGVLALPEHFSDLDGSICNMALSDAGYEIIAKGTSVKEQSTEISREDKVWTEGNMKRVLHLKRERQSGLASAKKEAFIDAHGRLFCERCQLEPIDAYGELGNACIEVHHIIPLSDNDRNPETKLDDLQCLCANCHRIVHKQMKENAKLENSLRSGTFDGWDWICHGED
jgi:5-methylcytosine-specific restriction protein A